MAAKKKSVTLRKAKSVAPKSKKIFLADLVTFYELSLTGTSSSILKLADIQKKYPSEYELFRKLSKDQSQLMALTDKLSDEQKAIVFEILLSSGTIANRVNHLLELTYAEKLELVKDIQNFGKLLKLKESKLKGAE
jgi:hypothetical protein